MQHHVICKSGDNFKLAFWQVLTTFLLWWINIYLSCLISVIKHKHAHCGPYNTSSKFKVEAFHGDKLLGSKVVASHLKDEADLTEVNYTRDGIIVII